MKRFGALMRVCTDETIRWEFIPLHLVLSGFDINGLILSLRDIFRLSGYIRNHQTRTSYQDLTLKDLMKHLCNPYEILKP